MIAGKDVPTFGEGKNSWLTGTAAWSFVSISQAILGVKPDYDGLRIEPCIPAEMKSYKISRRFRGAIYNISVENPNGTESGVKAVFVNGEKQEGALIPVFPAGSKVNVRIEMGREDEIPEGFCMGRGFRRHPD